MAYDAEKTQQEWNKWLKVKEIIGPENTKALIAACDLAAKQYWVDEQATQETPRVAEQFRTQANRCEKIGYWLEL
jgi:hypothetical protein